VICFYLYARPMPIGIAGCSSQEIESTGASECEEIAIVPLEVIKSQLERILVTAACDEDSRSDGGAHIATSPVMLLVIGIILLALWLLGVVAFKVTKGLIHVALVVALIVIIIHFLNGGR
jgi:hypothetical protein